MLKSFDAGGIALFLVGDLLHPAFPFGRVGKMSKGAVIPLYLAEGPSACRRISSYSTSKLKFFFVDWIIEVALLQSSEVIIVFEKIPILAVANALLEYPAVSFKFHQ